MAEPTAAELLKIVEALDPEKRQAEEQPPTDEELVEALSGLTDLLKSAVEGDKPNLEDARGLRAGIDKIKAEQVTRAEQVEADKAEAAKLLEGLKEDEKPKAETDGEGDGSEGSGDEGGEGEGSGEGETPPAPEAKTEKEKVPVAASLADAISRSQKRRLESVKEPERFSDVIVAAAGPAQGYGLDPNATLDDAADLFNKYAPQVKRGSAVLIHMDKIYPEGRSLSLSAQENTRLIDAVMAPRNHVITAAGGVCDPGPADFSHPICGDRGRPIRDSLPGFRADRGQVRFAPSATVADLEGAITLWTEATDADPGSATKDCPRVDCEAELSATVDAVVACLTVGNFQARFNPEFWRSRLDLLMVAHDRIAEQTMYATMLAAATTTLAPAAAADGTAIDVLRVVDMQVAGIQSRHRLMGTGFISILPYWLRAAMRDQIANQLPLSTPDVLDVADARLNQMFAIRGVQPVWSPDIELIGAQAGGAVLVNYNTPFTVLTFPQGTYMFFDGGTLDLGTNITDSTLNAVNDRQAFLETFEQVALRGCEAVATPVVVGEDCSCT